MRGGESVVCVAAPHKGRLGDAPFITRPDNERATKSSLPIWPIWRQFPKLIWDPVIGECGDLYTSVADGLVLGGGGNRFLFS